MNDDKEKADTFNNYFSTIVLITLAPLYRIYSITKNNNGICLNLSGYSLVLLAKFKNHSSKNFIRVDMTKLDKLDFSFKFTSQITK